MFGLSKGKGGAVDEEGGGRKRQGGSGGSSDGGGRSRGAGRPAAALHSALLWPVRLPPTHTPHTLSRPPPTRTRKLLLSLEQTADGANETCPLSLPHTHPALVAPPRIIARVSSLSCSGARDQAPTVRGLAAPDLRRKNRTAHSRTRTRPKPKTLLAPAGCSVCARARSLAALAAAARRLPTPRQTLLPPEEDDDVRGGALGRAAARRLLEPPGRAQDE